ncbi:MAG TPA: hypothetical protein PKA33_01505 [Amaricoccus sp.]|uniref:hypothetical protein n=1 Tax=Amaricoccus sp. TaxID=1872485 RepID=UPI002C6F44D7|nr:hypothetical protein [Amaricoccus sp.]HMQ38987.1 hypothetical protein [Micropruina sp.]HMR51229.1 hypothetical protein [Amaricoccus sp.]HMT98022.1 hypothetical protein [Amaricoccus sp.]
MARIYVASSWRNPYQPNIVGLLRKHAHEVYDFRNPPNGVPGFDWSELDPGWQSWTAEEYRRQLTTHPLAARGYLSDMRRDGMTVTILCALGAFTLPATPAQAALIHPQAVATFCTDPARYGAPVPERETMDALRREVDRLMEDKR